MGGKVWSEEEERVFWTEIIPSSKKGNLFTRPNNDTHGWEALRQVMQRRMGNLARRNYTALMLYEHFFQNCVLERFSPNAARFVRAYIADQRVTTGLTPIQRSRSAQSPRRGNSYRSPTTPRHKKLRVSAALNAGKAAAATQSFGQKQAGQQLNVLPEPLIVTNPGKGTGGSLYSRPYSGLLIAPKQSTAEKQMPPITALGFPSLFAEDPVQFSMPPLSAIMSLPLLQPPPAAFVAPPTLPTETLSLARVPLPDDFREQRQNLAPPPENLTNYMQNLKRTRERQELSRAGHNIMPFAPKVPRKTTDNGATFGLVADALALLPQRGMALPLVGHFSTSSSSAAAAKKTLSTIEEVKADEEADQLFVTQYN
ncbi:hypothetical protein Sste5346_000411 [Sporothrix stenoceras]|uniref:Uncharacterized protein n=1 Tax=Sporothrix stenoceras TaxID=5173 RepID=A0ABR3ZS76_9PEZI